jgi:hypothetical protein
MKKVFLTAFIVMLSFVFTDLKAQFKESFQVEIGGIIFIGCENMDADANKELVYANSSYIYIIDGQNGTIKWKSDFYNRINTGQNIVLNAPSFQPNVTPKLVDTNDDGRFEVVFAIMTSMGNTGICKISYDGSSSNPQQPDQKGEFVAQNFPNPFGDSTIVKYNVKSYGLVTLKIFDVQGTELYSLINEKKQSGDYEIKLDKLNLNSGTYYYQLFIGDEVGTKKMIKL